MNPQRGAMVLFVIALLFAVLGLHALSTGPILERFTEINPEWGGWFEEAMYSLAFAAGATIAAVGVLLVGSTERSTPFLLVFRRPDGSESRLRSVPWFWMFLSGPLYLLFLRLWVPGLVYVVLLFLIDSDWADWADLILVPFANAIVRWSTVRDGWIECVESEG